LFVVGVLWIVLASHLAAVASQGISTRFNQPLFQPLLQQLFWLFLLLIGFTLLSRPVVHPYSLRLANALPPRATTAEETQRGFALGWTMALTAILPMVLAGALHPHFTLAPSFWLPAIVSVVTIGVAMLAVEVAFRGFLFARLIAIIGPIAATIVLSLIFALAVNVQFSTTGLGFVCAFVAGIILSISYLRTHAVWFGWGMHSGWTVALAVFLGLPLAGYTTYNNLVTTDSFGADWLTGGVYGPDGAFSTLIILGLAVIPIYRLTRDYAWNYTHAPIVPMGAAVVIAPPAAHTEMEEAAAARPVPLVQILSSTPAQASTLPEIQQHISTLIKPESEQ
jgi:membrane protease YdiL (CAAX protease family)